MTSVCLLSLKLLRKVLSFCMPLRRKKQGFLHDVEKDPSIVSADIIHLLCSKEPCMIARYGSTELLCILNYLSIQNGVSIWKYVTGRSEGWNWNDNVALQMRQWSGFFPTTPKNLESFSKLMIKDSVELDYLGSWSWHEESMRPYFPIQMKSTFLRFLEPFYCDTPWTKALEGKRVLVIHPFADTIEKQYRNKREFLFENPDILPEFHLETIKAVQSLGGESDDFADWFVALHWMESEIDKRDYDICLIGCGAYGFPLAAHVKRMGKKAVHIGGALQLLFGIRGSRWEDPMYGVREWGIPEGFYSEMMNDNWVRPGECEKPKTADKVENGCYW